MCFCLLCVLLLFLVFGRYISYIKRLFSVLWIVLWSLYAMNFINVVGFVLTHSVHQPEELKLSQVRKCNQLIADVTTNLLLAIMILLRFSTYARSYVDRQRAEIRFMQREVLQTKLKLQIKPFWGGKNTKERWTDLKYEVRSWMEKNDDVFQGVKSSKGART